MENFETLRMLPKDRRAVVKRISVGGEMGRRIRDMGIVPEAELTVMGRAPLKDPVEIKLKGYNLTLRNNEADHILVQAVEG